VRDMHVNVYHSQFMYVFNGIHFNSDAISDPCDPDPCQNNGTCDSVSGNATCACPPEYKWSSLTEFGTALATILPILFQYCDKYCYSDSRNLWVVMKAGGMAF
jgi:hypothetical protein